MRVLKEEIEVFSAQSEWQGLRGVTGGAWTKVTRIKSSNVGRFNHDPDQGHTPPAPTSTQPSLPAMPMAPRLMESSSLLFCFYHLSRHKQCSRALLVFELHHPKSFVGGFFCCVLRFKHIVTACFHFLSHCQTAFCLTHMPCDRLSCWGWQGCLQLQAATNSAAMCNALSTSWPRSLGRAVVGPGRVHTPVAMKQTASASNCDLERLNL